MRHVNIAYEILGDKERRALWDEFGEIGLDPAFSAARARARAGFTDDIESWAQATPRGADVHDTLTISVLRSIVGGKVAYPALDIDVRIPAGVTHGQTLRLRGQGEAGAPPGDLLLTIKHDEDDDRWIWREDPDVYCILPLTWAESYHGGLHIRVRSPWGRTMIQLPDRPVGDGELLQLAGHGIRRAGEAPGDLYFQVKLVAPAAGDAMLALALNAMQATTLPRAELEKRFEEVS